AQLGVVCFRRRFEVDEEWQQARLNAALVGKFEQNGLGLVSSTMLGGRYAVRLCIMNHTSGLEDVHGTLEWFARQPTPSLSDPSSLIALSVEDRATTMTET